MDKLNKFVELISSPDYLDGHSLPLYSQEVLSKKNPITNFLIQNCEKYFNTYPLDLCLHNEEDEGRTEDPTLTRQRKAREEEGMVFLTQELPQSMIILIGFFTLFLFAGFYYQEFTSYLSKFLENQQNIEVSLNNISKIVYDNVWFFLKLTIPISLILLVVVIFFTMVQTKFHISFKLIKINFSKIAPSFKNLKEKTIFSKNQFFQSVKILLKLGSTITIVVWFIYTYYLDFWQLTQLNLYGSFIKANLLVFEMVLYLGLFLLLVSLPDWFLQKQQFLKKLKMTKEEVKREIKELEGDPQIKQKQKERAKQLVMKEKDLQKRVAHADVIITNPTHYACAIAYDMDHMDAPKVVAKGVDKAAFKIRKIAEDNYIPIVENKPLARALYAKVEIDEYIPVEFYKAISEIIIALDKFKEKFSTQQTT